MKKSIFTLALMIICAVSAYAQKKYTGIVNDPDGYTNVRAAASTKSSIVDRMDDGDLLYYTPMTNGWSKVYLYRNSKFIGYMHTSRIKRIDISKMSDPPTDDEFLSGRIVDPEDSYVNIRRGPGTNYAISGRLNVGTTVLYRYDNENWVKVYNKRTKSFLGYVASSRIY
jgi:uncharacterized protein YgiM (DUF1202 family)